MSSTEAMELEMTSRFAGLLFADILLFPFETVLQRYNIHSLPIV